MDWLHWLPIRARINFKIATLTYKTPSSGHPARLCELISPYQPSRSLRCSSQLLLTVPRANLTTGQRAFSYSSPVIWNAIPLSVRDAPSISIFKRRLISFHFHSYVCVYVCMFVPHAVPLLAKPHCAAVRQTISYTIPFQFQREYLPR